MHSCQFIVRVRTVSLVMYVCRVVWAGEERSKEEREGGREGWMEEEKLTTLSGEPETKWRAPEGCVVMTHLPKEIDGLPNYQNLEGGRNKQNNSLRASKTNYSILTHFLCQIFWYERRNHSLSQLVLWPPQFLRLRREVARNDELWEMVD